MKTVVSLFTGLGCAIAVMWEASSTAAEQRCNDLGANCLCSEPFQMTSFAQDTAWYNPNDSTINQCNGENVGTGETIVRPDGSNPPQVGSDPAVLAALPPGHSLQRYFRTNEGYTGIYELGHYLGVNNPDPPQTYARVATRWYMYFSPNFQWGTTGSCANVGKWFVPYTGGGQWSTNDGNNTWWNFYGLGAYINGQYGSWEIRNHGELADPQQWKRQLVLSVRYHLADGRQPRDAASGARRR